MATWSFDYSKKVLYNGKIITASREGLKHGGPILPVTITLSSSYQEYHKKHKIPIHSYKTLALIDTGARTTVISPNVVKKLGFDIKTIRDFTKLNTLHGAKKAHPVFLGKLICKELKNSYIDARLAIADLKLLAKDKIDCIIGRNILKHLLFIYNGFDGAVTLSSREDLPKTYKFQGRIYSEEEIKEALKCFQNK